jgi:LGFP repeat
MAILSAISKKHTELLSAGINLGKATSDEKFLSRDWQSPAQYQVFENGTIIYSAQFGAYYLSKRISDKWHSPSVQNTLYNPLSTIMKAIGYPVADTAKVADGTEICVFGQGMIISKSDGSSFVLAGAIFERYLEEMGASGSNIGHFPGWMGYPLGDIQWRVIPGVQEDGKAKGYAHFCRFQHADLFNKEGRSRALWVRGDIRKFYNNWGDIGSKLGCPVTDEHPITREGKEIGWACMFEEGVIFWSPATGAHALPSLLAKAYMEQYFGPAGDLGFPESEPKETSSQVVYVNFQNGFLYQQNERAPVEKISSLSVRVLGFTTDEKDDDLAVKATVEVKEPGKPPLVFHKDYGEYPNGNFTVAEADKVMCSFPIRNAETTVVVKMVASEVDSFLNFGDDPLGDFTKIYSINTLWDTSLPDMLGSRLENGGEGEDGKFACNFRIDPDNIKQIDPNDSKNFRANLWWDSENYKVESLSKKTYAATYSDVEADDSVIFHPWNHFFYKALYESSAENGVCFGMCAEAIYALKNDSVSQQYISKYKGTRNGAGILLPDSTRDDNFQIKFGYQLGGDQIMYIISEVVDGNTWDPVDAFYRSRSMFQSGDFPILCISDGATSASGHAVVPYHWVPNGNTLTIWIADPNRPISKFPDKESPLCTIVIDKEQETFSYIYEADKVWTGGSGAFNGGRLFPMPYHTFSSKPHTPFWELGFAIIGGDLTLGLAKLGFTMILFSGAVGASDIVNERGEAYFENRAALFGRNRIKNLTHISPFTATTRESLPRFFVLDASPNLSAQTQSGLAVAHNKWHLGHIATAVQSHVFAKSINPNNLSTFYAEELVQALQPVFEQRKAQTAGATLHFDLFNFGDGDYTWSLYNAFCKIVLTSNSISDTTDRVVAEDTHSTGQSLTFRAADARGEEAVAKRLKAHFISPDSKRAFILENISVAPGKEIAFQQNNGMRQLIVHNSGNATMVDLSYYAKRNSNPSMLLPGVSLPPNIVTVFEALGDQSIRKEVYEYLEGPLVSSQTFSVIKIDCRNLIHEWLVLFNTGTGDAQTSTNPVPDKPERGWFFAKDRIATFLVEDGEYGFNVQSAVLSVIRFKVEEGKIVYDPRFEGVLSGAGSNTLVLHGLNFTIDARAVKNKLIFLPSVYGFSGDDPSKTNRPLVTGKFLPTSTDGKDGWAYFFNTEAGKVSEFTFQCCLDGKIRFSTKFKADAKGNGTSKLKVLKL